jgi:hypothetical protein
VLIKTTKVFSARDSEHCWVVTSQHANRKSHPLQASLAQAEEIRTGRDASEINVGSQYYNAIFEFSRGTRAEQFSATRIEQRYIVRPLVASDWQLQVQALCVTRSLQWRLTSLGWVFSACCRTTTQIENHNHGSLHLRSSSHPEPSRYRKDENRRRGKPNLNTPSIHCLLTELGELLKARAAGAEVIEPTIRF